MKKVLSFMLIVLLLLSMLPTGALLVSAEQVTTKMVGDLDQDGEVTDWDGVLLARHLAGWAVTVADEKILDIDGDGEITDWDGVMFDRHLAGWSVVTQVGKRMTYTITYENTKDAVNTNPASYENGGTSVVLTPLEAEHYTFAGWYIGDNKVTHIPTDGEGDLTITARWTPVEYMISYANTKGAINSNPGKYHIESDNIVLQNLVCEGYLFDGWYNGNKKVTVIPTGTTGDITLTAKWTACDYTITYENTKGTTNNNPNGFSTDSATITLSDLEKEGYAFDGWYNGNTKVTTIPSGTTGNITLTAQWTPISYSATFTADGSVVATRYFTIEDEAISNIPNVPSKAGYTGAWSNYSLGTSNIVIPAVYTLNEYTITYANTKGAENSNPNNYTVITSTFQLSELQFDGYDFIGWYKGNTKVTSVEKGTTGNITLTAKWSPVQYVITYTDTKGATNANPVEYNVETGTIYLTNLVAEHYTFDGWYKNGKKVTSIPAGGLGDIELVARWTPVSYTITYQNTKGATNGNPATYTVEDLIILQDVRKEGYTFDGWYMNGEKVDGLSVGSSGNKTLIAKWTPITYTVTYNDEKNISHNNPATYTADSGAIALASLSANGYTFEGWYNGSQKVTTIPTGSYGDLVLTAKWSIITYTITYTDMKGCTNNNLTTYTVEDIIILEDLVVRRPYTLGYVFDGWYSGSEKIAKIDAGSCGDLTLTAKWTPYVYEIVYKCEEGVKNPNTLSGFVTVESFPVEKYELLDPSRDGYTFDGWKCSSYAGITYAPKWLSAGGLGTYTRSNGQIIMEPKWIPLEYTINYTTSEKYAGILMHANSNPQMYTAGSTLTLQDPTPVTGYTFEGWYENAAYTKPITAIEKDRWGNLTLYAKYSFNGTYIRTTQDFVNIAYDPSGSYMLANDIAIDDTICNSPTPFTGVFNGNGYTVTGRKVYNYTYGRYDTTAKTMFGENNGLIVNTISCGGIANVNSGSIIRCGREYGQTSVIDVVVDNYSYSGVGGITSVNSGLIQECYSIGSISTGDRTVGGVAGVNSGTIKDCYYDGYIYIDDYFPRTAGGIAGINKGEITGCYAEGKISYEVGPNVPDNYAFAIAPGNFIRDCFAEVDCSGYGFVSKKLYMSRSADVVFNCYGAKEKTYSRGNTNLVDSINFKSKKFMIETVGWSEDVWYFENGSLPKLKWEQ